MALLQPEPAAPGGAAGMSEVRPFHSATAAWLWCRAQLRARGDGRGVRFDAREGSLRPCEPDDILRHLAAMHDDGQLTLAEARVLAKFGDANRVPDEHAGEAVEARTWRKVMAVLEERLVRAGIVSRPDRQAVGGQDRRAVA